MTDLTSLPENLPQPADDGACDHLVGLALPDVQLASTMGGMQSLREVSDGRLVLYVYPRTGGPGITLPSDWDMIPGARGCTPQSCAFRDHHGQIAALGATVWGLSAQPMGEQMEFVERIYIPFPLLNDAARVLAETPLRLPTFMADGMTLYKRVTLVVESGIITHVFYPVFPPDRNARDVIEYLRQGD